LDLLAPFFNHTPHHNQQHKTITSYIYKIYNVLQAHLGDIIFFCTIQKKSGQQLAAARVILQDEVASTHSLITDGCYMLPRMGSFIKTIYS
jgi:hypothetical protein